MLMAGTNNISPKLGVGRQVTTVPAFEKQYSTLLETVRVKYPNALIVVHDLFPRFDSGRWQYELSHTDMATRTLQFNQVLQDLCTDCDKVCFSSSHAESLADIRRYIAKDGLHLTRDGKQLLQRTTVQVCRSSFSHVSEPDTCHPYCPSCPSPSSVCKHPYHMLSNVSLKEHSVHEFTSSIHFRDLNKRAAHYYGEHPYGYGCLIHSASPMWGNPLIQSIADEIKGILPNVMFNSVLVNYYENGYKSIPFHSDNEAEIVEGSTIISVSYGATRRFQFRRLRKVGNDYRWVDLTPGNIVVMSRASQNIWQHSVPKELQVTEPRINLTFRLIEPAGVLSTAVQRPAVLKPSPLTVDTVLATCASDSEMVADHFQAVVEDAVLTTTSLDCTNVDADIVSDNVVSEYVVSDNVVVDNVVVDNVVVDNVVVDNVVVDNVVVDNVVVDNVVVDKVVVDNVVVSDGVCDGNDVRKDVVGHAVVNNAAVPAGKAPAKNVRVGMDVVTARVLVSHVLHSAIKVLAAEVFLPSTDVVGDSVFVGDSVVGDHVVGDFVVGDRVVGGSVVSDHVVGGSVVGDHVVGDSVDGDRVVVGDSVDGDRVVVGDSVDADHDVVGGSVVGDHVVGDSVVGDHVVGDSVVGDHVVGGFVVGDNVVGDFVVGDNVVGDFVVGDNVGDAAVVAGAVLNVHCAPSRCNTLSGGGSSDLHDSKLRAIREAELLDKRNAEKLRRDSLTAEQKALALAEHKEYKKLRRDSLTAEQKALALAERIKSEKLRSDSLTAEQKALAVAEHKKSEKLRRDSLTAEQKALALAEHKKSEKLRRDSLTAEQKALALAEHKKSEKLRRDSLTAEQKALALAERKQSEKLRRDALTEAQKADKRSRNKDAAKKRRMEMKKLKASQSSAAFPAGFTPDPQIINPTSSLIRDVSSGCTIGISADAVPSPPSSRSTCTDTIDHSYLADISEPILVRNELPNACLPNAAVNPFLTIATVSLPRPKLCPSFQSFTYNCPCKKYRSNCELELRAHFKACPQVLTSVTHNEPKITSKINPGIIPTPDTNEAKNEAKKIKQREASKRYREKKKREKLQSESVNEKLKNTHFLDNAPPPLIAASTVVSRPEVSDQPTRTADIVSGTVPTSNLLPAFVSPILALPQATQDKLISDFHKESSQYPEFPCDTCKRTCFWHDVHLVSSADTVIDTVASSVAPPPKYMCKRCKSYLKKDAMCPLDEKNNLKVGHMPPHLNLNHTEARLCSQRYIFCKIFNLPPGGQLSVQGKCTNVPVDPSEVMIMEINPNFSIYVEGQQT